MATLATPLTDRSGPIGTASAPATTPAAAAGDSRHAGGWLASPVQRWYGPGTGVRRVTQAHLAGSPGKSLVPLPAAERATRKARRVSPALLDLYRLLLKRFACREVATGGALCNGALANRAQQQTTDQFLSLFDCLARQLRRPTPLIQFIGIKGGEGASTLARRFAGVVAEFEDGSVLTIERQAANPAAKTGRAAETARWAEPMTSALALADVGSTGVFACNWEKMLEAAAEMPGADPVRNGAALIDLLRPAFRMVILDAGPALREPQSLAISPYADAVILIIDASKTTADAASSAVTRIRASGGNVLGTILNRQARPARFLGHA